MKCTVCRTTKQQDFLCVACSRSYDRWRDSDANEDDTLSLIAWAAGRGRFMLRRSQRAREECA